MTQPQSNMRQKKKKKKNGSGTRSFRIIESMGAKIKEEKAQRRQEREKKRETHPQRRK